MGINPKPRVLRCAWGWRLALAGAAGSLLMAVLFGLSDGRGQVFVLMAFVGRGARHLGANVIGALVASLMMGIAEVAGGSSFVGADSGLIVVFLMLLLTAGVQAERPWRGTSPMTTMGFQQARPVLARCRRSDPDRLAAGDKKFVRGRHFHPDFCCFPSIGVAWESDGADTPKQLSPGPCRLFSASAPTPRPSCRSISASSPWIGMVAGGGGGDAGEPADRRPVLSGCAAPIFSPSPPSRTRAGR